VRLIGLVVLGKPIQDRPGARGDLGLTGRAGVVLLAVACLALAALAPPEIRMIGAGLAPVLPAAAVTGALKSPWVLQPVFAGFSILSPSWLWVVMPALFAVVAVIAWLASGARLVRVRRVPAWRSATAGVSGHDSYTAFGFANPTRRVLAAVLHTRAEVTRFDAGQDDAGPAAGQQDAPSAVAHVGYSSDVIEVVEEYLYRPFRRPFALLVRLAQRLQSGRLDAYLAYMLITLVALLAVVTGLH
jgi:hydrogenase-4 component B